MKFKTRLGYCWRHNFKVNKQKYKGKNKHGNRLSQIKSRKMSWAVVGWNEEVGRFWK